MDELFVPFNAVKFLGRPRRFAKPSQMLKAFEEYVEDRKSRAIEISEDEESSNSNGFSSDHSKVRKISHPLSIRDFCVHLGMTYSWWRNLPDEFLTVKEAISDFIFGYQLKGAESGMFNANIVARELGLADKTDTSVKIAEIPKAFTKEQAKDFVASMNK